MLKKNQPLYFQIYEHIKDKIINGTYKIDTLLPTETDFASEYNVSLVTVRSAIELLQNEQYVEKKRGKGTKVINNGVISRLSTGKSFSKILEEKFNNIEKNILETKLLANEDSILKVQSTLVTRIYNVDNRPYIYMENYIADDLSKVDIGSLYETLHKRGYRFAKFRDKFKVDKGNSKVKEIMNCEGPFLKRIRTTYLEDGTIIEIAISYYNTEVSDYEFEFLTS